MKRITEADLRLLRIFATIADCKGFAAAQAELNLSAPSISGYVSALEQRLGVRLCSRGRAGFALTDKGALIHREAQRLFLAVEAFTAAAGTTRGRLTGTLRVGAVDCTVTDPHSPLGRAVQRFNERDHDVRIELTIQAPQDLQRSVLDGSLDLAVGSFPARIAALLSHSLYRERNSFYCAAGHALFAMKGVTLEEIRAQRVVARGYWRRGDLGRLGVEREAAAVDNMEAQAILILSGAYLGYLPEHYAKSLEAAGSAPGPAACCRGSILPTSHPSLHRSTPWENLASSPSPSPARSRARRTTPPSRSQYPNRSNSTHAAYEASAALVHVHVRDERENPSSDPERFAAFQDAIRSTARTSSCSSPPAAAGGRWNSAAACCT